VTADVLNALAISPLGFVSNLSWNRKDGKNKPYFAVVMINRQPQYTYAKPVASNFSQGLVQRLFPFLFIFFVPTTHFVRQIDK